MTNQLQPVIQVLFMESSTVRSATFEFLLLDVRKSTTFFPGGRKVSLAIGIYAGIYLDQYYSLPKIVGPMDLYDKIKDEMEKHKKDNPGPSRDDR